jgi:hypothetical protein
MTEKVEEKKKDEDWMQKKWRPAMGWMYMVVCFFDMVVFPVAWSILQTVQQQTITQWNPLTLQGAGLFHLAMGAVLGIAAFGRTQEKIAGTATNAPAPSIAPPPAAAPMGAPVMAPAPVAAAAPVRIEPVVEAAPPVVAGFGGKLAPPAAPQPLL